MERHMKLHHSDGKYAQCSVPNCHHICLKDSMDDHVKEMHMVSNSIVCEECGMVFNDRMEYRRHRDRVADDHSLFHDCYHWKCCTFDKCVRVL